MFSGAVSFNQPIDDWDVSNVKNMNWMFNGASSFCQSIDKWEVNSCPIHDMKYIFDFSPLKHNPPEWYKKMIELYNKKEG
jgi:surface protein